MLRLCFGCTVRAEGFNDFVPFLVHPNLNASQIMFKFHSWVSSPCPECMYCDPDAVWFNCFVSNIGLIPAEKSVAAAYIRVFFEKMSLCFALSGPDAFFQLLCQKCSNSMFPKSCWCLGDYGISRNWVAAAARTFHKHEPQVCTRLPSSRLVSLKRRENPKVFLCKVCEVVTQTESITAGIQD